MLNKDYNLLERFMHKLSLGSTSVTALSFELENLLNQKAHTKADNHIFITGLARSGTTILMNYLHETGIFRSLTYADMPFVLMPNIWKMFSKSQIDKTPKERTHKDGIFIGYDSPEALEEVFWRTFCEEEYILTDRLKLHIVNDEVINKFKRYIDLILMSSDNQVQTCYLSKNNNNILRLSSIKRCFPNSRIIITFRDPLQHAISLLKQHINFSNIQSKESFSLNYMNWLGHFEFGLNQKPFWLNDDLRFNEIILYDKMDINFWLASWKNYYLYINEHIPSQSIFFCFEAFCKNPAKVLEKLFSILDIKSEMPYKIPYELKNIQGYIVDQKLLNDCNKIYQKLIKKHIDVW